ncbi:MAG: DUF3372 domain-containing protein, partial [Massilia sp.]|nr:DUF3372 domain-containing protein [Massilia sp.]
MRRLALAAALAAWGSVCAATLADCDSPAFATVLQPMPAPAEARAIWLNKRQAKWPGVEARGTFRLVGSTDTLTLDAAHAADGVLLTVRDADLPRLPELHRQALVLEHDGIHTRLQAAAALDDLYAQAASASDLGVTVGKSGNAFAVWAPTAQDMAVCIYDDEKALAVLPMRRDDTTGIWRAKAANGKYYTYLADVIVPGTGLVRNRVTDPYSISLNTDSRRSYIGSLDAMKPAGWDNTPAPKTVKAQTDMVVYELHVRDFSVNDATVSAAHRGKYAAFSEPDSNGMRHLAALQRSGLTDVHLLPVFDFASVPEQGCVGTSCYNWGYDPYHYSAPEGSYATDPSDGACRVIEMRKMVMNLHRIGLRVGMDVVYNHTFAAGQKEQSVLDRLVPGYYHRLDAAGAIEQSTCCDNTATEHRMMGKLMIDSVALWARHYKIDSFRFDLMGHQPRSVMEALQKRVNAEAGHPVQLIGEGWNFGEVANG